MTKSPNVMFKRPDREYILVIVLSILIGLGALVWSFQNDLILAYNDAIAHLNIARRVWDNRTPGIAQLGTVWLPVPHILIYPFTYIDGLWFTGLAGSIVGLGCFVITALALFLSARLVTRHKLSAWLGLGVFLFNPNILYLQTTALTEPVLLMAMTSSNYFLLRWNASGTYRHLVMAGALAALAVGSRYDGWFFALASLIVVLLIVFWRSHDPARTEGTTLAYAVLPVYAMFLWFFYNWQIFGDPLEFQRGQFSAQFQQEELARAGALPTKFDWVLSLWIYSWAVIDNLGMIVTVLAVMGVVLYLVTKGINANTLIPYLFLSAYPFNVISLWLGQSVLVLPQSVPPGLFNVRYGIMLLPAATLFIALFADFLVQHSTPVIVVAALGLLLAIQCVSFIPDWRNSVINVAEGFKGFASTMQVRNQAVADYLHRYYNGGGILIDDTYTANIILRAQIPMREYIATFNGPLWYNALREPSAHVRWIVFKKYDAKDRVSVTLGESAKLTQHYAPVFEANGWIIYRRVER